MTPKTADILLQSVWPAAGCLLCFLIECCLQYDDSKGTMQVACYWPVGESSYVLNPGRISAGHLLLL